MAKRILLKNGNIVIVQSERYAYNKCLFTYTIYQKDGSWQHSEHDIFTMGYYQSVEEYINNNFQ